jgi:multicomponent Na+:H+ antiporter subunit E
VNRSLVVGIWCVVVWIVLWRDLSWANVVSGVVVAAAVLALFPFVRPAERLRLRPVALVRFLAVFAWSVVKANLIVAWEVVTPRNRINEGVVAVPLSSDAPAVITLVSHAIGLAPGTMVIDIERDPTVLHVHVLHLRSVEAVRAEVLELERLVLAAIHGRSAP